jgi:hypothetical protein
MTTRHIRNAHPLADWLYNQVRIQVGRNTCRQSIEQESKSGMRCAEKP